MKALVLWADSQVSPNLGVRALGAGCAALVQATWPGAEVAFHHFGQGGSMPVVTLRQLARERVTSRFGMARWLKGFDVVLDTRSGDSFADIYGLKRLARMTAFGEAVTRAGVPYVLSPQTIGPFESRRGRAVARYTMRTADLVMARDSRSRDACAQLGRPADVLTTDVVFSLPVPQVPRTRDVLLNVSGLLWQDSPHVDAAGYRAVVRDVYDRLTADGRTVGLLAHVLDSPHPDNDVPAIREFASACGDSPEVVVPTSLEDVREAVASARAVIGSRMHACLNALSVGTPAVALAYSRKFAPLLGDLGWDHTVDLRDDPDPAGHALEALAAAESGGAVEDVRRRAHDLTQLAQDALRGVA